MSIDPKLISRAVYDPGAVVGNRLDPAWGEGNPGYAEEPEQLWEWIVRAVCATVDNHPRIVVLCGSTRFSHAFREANLRETLAGRIVLTIGCDMRSDAELFAHLDEAAIARIKSDLDELHKRKIDLADEVLVLNVGGYVGDSTRSEIEYARALGKPVRWLDETQVPA